MTTDERAQRASETIEEQIGNMLSNHWREIESSWAKADGEEPKMRLSISVTLAGAFDAPVITTALAYGVRVKDEISTRLDDPAQMKLPLEGKR